MSDSVRPHRRQPTRLPRPWDSPGKNNGVGCHFLLQFMKVKCESEVAQSCLTLSDPMDCSLTGSSVHGISKQAYWSGVPLPSPIEPFNFTFFSITGQGIDLDYCDIEWFALEINRDHSVVFEIASKSCISDYCWLLHFF